MKVSATYMNIYLPNLKSVQSSSAAAAISSFNAASLTLSVHVCKIG